MGKKRHVTVSEEGIEVTWDGSLCIHVEECVRAKGALFVAGRKPWFQAGDASVESVAEVVERCPTGALFHRRDDGVEEVPASRNTIVVSPDGPLYLRGELEIEGTPDDAPGLKTRAGLCRCGASGNKPFCDGSHARAGFRDAGAIGERGDAPDATGSGGPLTVKPAPNGPLLVAGSCELVSGSGRTAWCGKKAALCRCGASENKPFCDGAHARVGFESGD